MEKFYRISLTIAIFVLFSGTAIAQNVLQGADMENEDSWSVSQINSDTEVVYEFGYTETTPAEGEGGALMITASVSGTEGDQLANFVLYQEVTLEGGESYFFDGAFKDVDGVDQFWAEVYIESNEPEVGEDWGGDQFAGFNTWGGCGTNVDGTFADDGCEGEGDNIYTVEGEGSQTLFFGIKVGAGNWDGVTNAFTILIDEISLTNVVETSARQAESPQIFSLKQNYPNPFNPTTVINFNLMEASHVTLEVFSVIGEKVAVLLNETRSAGSHSISFDAGHLSSGLYLYRMQSGDFVQTRQMQLIK